MTNKKKRLVPQLRFKGFTNDWEQRKLGDVVTRLKSYPLSRDVETTENSGYRYIHYGDIHTRVADVIDDESVLPQINPGKYEPIETGDLCLADASEDYQDIAAPSVLLAEHKDNVVAGLHTIALRPDDADPLFLYFLFKAPDFRHYVYREGQGLKVFGISAWSVLDYTCAFPSMTEQAEIVKLLRSFDTAIALHQRKHGLLLKLKQGYLQRLFPENGSKIPELRLQGFTNDWEQRKLGELTEERTDRSSQGELLSVTMHDGIKKFKELGKKDNSSKNKSNYKVIKAGDIGYNSMRMWQGASGLSQWTGIVSPAYTIVKVGPQLNPQFLAYSFKRPTMIWNFQTHSQGLTSDTWNLKFPELSKLKLRFPNLEEQQEIVSLLSKLDDTIALHQKQLDQLKKLKQAYLQKLVLPSKVRQ